ncbi:transcriptional regulator [Solitalea longa]|uniref:Transcriptional regulator n=1 Tax=Solitalea longa TaxID=2079460 RepID=A0A2S5A289_9SPHI|nr:transcriptional regulator [Solitalea longa]POY36419.1 transcriptional regulator [Solitalea longa]
MNYIKHLTGFFNKVMADDQLNPTHISLYISLFQFWNVSRFQNPISISRDEVMRVSKISAKATYHKCMKDLHNYGYIKYDPSYNPFRGSLVHLINFADDLKPVQKRVRNKAKTQSDFEQALNKQQTSSGTASGTGSETGTEQALVPYINNINNIKTDINKLNIAKHRQANPKNKSQKFSSSKEDLGEGIRKSSPSGEDLGEVIPPSQFSVLQFFQKNNWPEIEAQKFFNHFEANGWKVGGKSAMKNWMAAARNWMINSEEFQKNENQSGDSGSPKKGNLHASTSKNYAEPL